MVISGSEITLGGLPRTPQNDEADQKDTNEKDYGIQSASDTDVEAQDLYDPRLVGSSVAKRLTLTFKNLTVRGTSSDAALGETLWSRVDPTQILDVFRGGKTRGNKVR